MITDQPKNFTVDIDTCIACGSCTKICPTQVIKLEDKIPFMIDQTGNDYWNTCWECHRCLAVCPKAAISICNKNPEKSWSKKEIPNKDQMRALIANRRSIRNFKDKQVDKELIDELLRSVGNQPTGGNEQLVMFSVLDNIEETKKFKDLLFKEFENKLKQNLLPEGYDKERMQGIIDKYHAGHDAIFHGAPHIVIPHAKTGHGEPVFDTSIALSYLELLMCSAGIGTVIQSFARSLLEICPESRKALNIPDDHYFNCAISFGYPGIKFFRGVQRQDVMNINRVKI